MSDAPISFLERKRKRCYHNEGLLFDDDEAFAECKKCGAQVTLGFALNKMMQAESRAKRIIARAKLEEAERQKRSKTKCQHCHRLTRISTNVKDYHVLQLAEREE